MKKINGKNKYLHLQSSRLVKAKAKELMLSNENHIKLILAIIIAFTTAVMPIMMLSLIYDYISDDVYNVAFIVLEVLLTAPFAYGLLHMVSLMNERGSCELSELFCAFTSLKCFIKSVVTFLMSLLILALPFLAASLPVVLGEFLIGLGVTPILVEVISSVASIVFFVFTCGFSCRLSVFPMLAVKEKGIFRSLKKSFLRTRKKGVRILGFAFSFLPLLIVSVAAILIPLVIYTLPYMLCAYSVGVENICENNE